MKVRIGVGVGAAATSAGTELASLVGDMDELGFDSLWLSEVLATPAVDPLVGLAFAAAANGHLKLGTTMVLPGRNPVRLAKELATLDRLASGRLLVTMVPGLTTVDEASAIGVPLAQRGALIDEVLPLLRRFWAGEPVTHDGPAGHWDGLTVEPRPLQDPLEVWLGGTAKSALVRCGLLGDGWLPSLCTHGEAAAGRAVIEKVAADAGREISVEHFGASIGYSRGPLEGSARDRITRRRKDVSPEELVPVGLPALRTHLERYLEIGFSKFVVRPLAPPASWRDELERLAEAVGDLQT